VTWCACPVEGRALGNEIENQERSAAGWWTGHSHVRAIMFANKNFVMD